MIVLDSSAVIAILYGEPAAETLVSRLDEEPVDARFISAANYVEAGTVVAGRKKDEPGRAVIDLDGFLADFRISVVGVSPDHAHLALQARIAFGRGMGHGGKLNFGDCFAYALAKSLNAPLLFVGDFKATDIPSAL